MNSASIRSGDIVRCNVRGGHFWAMVSAPMREIEGLGKRITLEPMEGQRGVIPAQWVTSRQIVGHWRQAKGSQI